MIRRERTDYTFDPFGLNALTGLVMGIAALLLCNLIGVAIDQWYPEILYAIRP